MGVPIPSGMPTPSGCDPGLDFGLAEVVCRTDPYCCQSYWDSICVGEVSHAAWTNEQRLVSDAGNAIRAVILEADFQAAIAIRSCISATPN